MKNFRSFFESMVEATIKALNEKRAKSQNSTEDVDFIDVSEFEAEKQSRETRSDQRPEVKIIHVPKSEKLLKYKWYE